MLNNSDLKNLLHKKGLSRLDQLLLILTASETPSSIQEIRKTAREAGLKTPPSWNMSSTLLRSQGRAIRTPKGWEITESGRLCLQNLGLLGGNPVATQIATDLRAELLGIKKATTRDFVEEAIKCYEAGLHRSAVVMSWLAAVDVLHHYVHSNYLAAFNAESKRIDPKWKDAKTTDDLGKLKESDFLDRLVSLSIIGKNVKKELKDCLDRRNGCGHPNSLKIGPSVVAHHIEILLLNIFRVFN